MVKEIPPAFSCNVQKLYAICVGKRDLDIRHTEGGGSTGSYLARCREAGEV